MTDRSAFKTEQEAFWAGAFGTEYIRRNAGDKLLAANVSLFARALARAGAVSSCLELGANIGMNLRALELLHPGMKRCAVEINPDAARALAEVIGPENVFTGSILDYEITSRFDLTIAKGVLIHIDPAMLHVVYRKLYDASRRLILVAEYYNPTPVAVPYRGHADRLFKRDFAGEMLDLFPELRLVDYGFVYRRDPAFPQDDVNWFLLERPAG